MVINIYSNCCIAGVVEKMKKLDQVTAGSKRRHETLSEGCTVKNMCGRLIIHSMHENCQENFFMLFKNTIYCKGLELEEHIGNILGVGVWHNICSSP